MPLANQIKSSTVPLARTDDMHQRMSGVPAAGMDGWGTAVDALTSVTRSIEV